MCFNLFKVFLSLFPVYKEKLKELDAKESFERLLPVLERQNAAADLEYPEGAREGAVFFVGRTPVTQRLADLCRYSCRECSEQVDSLSALRSHYRSLHPAAPDSDLDARCAVALVLYSYRLCEEVVPCDRARIFEHAQKKHSMNGSTYRLRNY